MAAFVSSIAQRAPISVTLHYIAVKPATYHLRANRASSGLQLPSTLLILLHHSGLRMKSPAEQASTLDI
jgi:hypothetical protein